MDIDYYCEKYISSFNKFNYIVYGQENLLQDNSREVIRIVIYDSFIFIVYN